MKRLGLALILFLILASVSQAQEPDHKFYFPIIEDSPCFGGGGMSDFKVIVPASTTNRVLNPSGEIAGNFAAESGTTVTRVTTFQHYGLYSYRVETNANNEGIELTLSALSNAIHYVTLRARGTIPASWDWSLNDVNFSTPTLLETLDGDWKLYGLQFPATQANGSVKLSIHQNGTGSGDFYLDGIQVEENTTWTTFCDGTQPGCEWNGAEHASTSTRSAASRAGGRVYDLEDDYGLNISGMSGTGTSPQELFVDSYSQLPGGELNAIKTNSRVITLTGLITGTTQADFHAKKQALKSILAKDSVPQDQNGFQPVRLRYTGATVHKEIAVHYEGGLEAAITANDPCGWEIVAIRFIAPNPYWYEIGESAALLDTNDTATFEVVAARLRSTGQWSNLGPPNAAGTYGSVIAMAEDATYVYMGGNFQNFDNIAAADRIVRYNKQTGAYSALGSGLNGIVYALAIGPTGLLYIGGAFTDAGGVAAADYFCVWNGSAFAAIGTPNTGTASITQVQALLFDGAGNLYIGGIFTNFADIAAADQIVKLTVSTSTYSALSTGLGATGAVQALELALDKSTVYIGGSFTVGPSYLATWDGTTLAAVDSSIGGNVTALAVDNSGILYLFTQDGNVFYSWNGQGLSLIGTANDFADNMKIGPDGTLYASGFSVIDGLTLESQIARFNGYSWAGLDLDLPGTPTVAAILASKYVDPAVPQKYNLWLGSTASGTGAFAGLVTATNSGTVPAFPKIYFSRSGGTTATIQTLKNETNGQEILFNYSLLGGETLAIDLDSPKKTIISNFFGPRQNAALANSDLGEWQLLSGPNSVTSFVSTSGSPTITAWALWKDQFDGQD